VGGVKTLESERTGLQKGQVVDLIREGFQKLRRGGGAVKLVKSGMGGDRQAEKKRGFCSRRTTGARYNATNRCTQLVEALDLKKKNKRGSFNIHFKGGKRKRGE